MRGVREVAAVGFANLPEGEEIAAFVVPSGNLTEASLVAHCRARLSSDKRPRKLVRDKVAAQSQVARFLGRRFARNSTTQADSTGGCRLRRAQPLPLDRLSLPKFPYRLGIVLGSSE